MVSKASDDLPEPERPVMTVRLPRGISTSMFLRLCSRAPRTTILSMGDGSAGMWIGPEPFRDKGSAPARQRAIAAARVFPVIHIWRGGGYGMAGAGRVKSPRFQERNGQSWQARS